MVLLPESARPFREISQPIGLTKAKLHRRRSNRFRNVLAQSFTLPISLAPMLPSSPAFWLVLCKAFPLFTPRQGDLPEAAHRAVDMAK